MFASARSQCNPRNLVQIAEKPIARLLSWLLHWFRRRRTHFESRSFGNYGKRGKDLLPRHWVQIELAMVAVVDVLHELRD